MNVIQLNDRIVIDGKQLPTTPNNKGCNNITIIGDKIYVNGYEWRDNEWVRTEKSLFYNVF